jgi:uncharacterized membrane protein YfcA
MYNVIASPGALYRYWRQGQTGGRLAALLTCGTLPGVVAGSMIRVYLLPGARVFSLVVAAVLLPLGAWLAAVPQTAGRQRPPRLAGAALVGLAAAVGCIGGIYGIGGGSILAPALISDGRSPLPQRSWRPGLAHRSRSRRRRPRRQLHRSPPPATTPRTGDPRSVLVDRQHGEGHDAGG